MHVLTATTSDLVMADSGPWRLSVFIGVPIGLLFLILALLLMISLFRDHSDFDTWAATLVLGGIGAVVLLWSLWPFQGQYLQWRAVSGTVEKIDSRLISQGEGMSERYVVTIGGQPFGVDDTRAATLEVGDTVELSCRRDWEYAANDGYVCRWGGVQN